MPLERRVFKVQPIISFGASLPGSLGKIESICVEGYKLFVAFGSTVKAYELQDDISAVEALHASSSSLESGTKESFYICNDKLIAPVHAQAQPVQICKKPITRLECLKDLGILVSFSEAEGLVHLHDLDSFDYITTFSNCKSVSHIATLSHIEIINTIPTLMTKLCIVGQKKRIYIFEWRETEFFFVKELLAPDRVKAIHWSRNGKSIIVACGKDYILMPLDGGSLYHSKGSGELSSTSSNSKIIIPFGKAKPLITPLENEEVMVVKDLNGVYVNSNEGFILTEKKLITFNEAVENLSKYSHYFNTASCESHECVQKINMKGFTKVSTHRSWTIVSSENKVNILAAVSIMQQIDELVQLKEFDEAIAILNSHQKIPKLKKIEKLRQIKGLYAFQKFRKSEFEDAISLFIESATDPVLVLGLFPNLIPENLRNIVVYPESVDLEDLDKPLESKAFLALIRFLTVLRTKLHSKARKEIFLKEHYSSRRNSHVESASAPPTPTSKYESNLLELIDTCLLKTYLSVNPALVGPLVRVTNDCNETETEALLSQHGKYKELIDFFYGKGRHEKSMDLIRKSFDEATATKKTIEYLKRLGSEHLELILKYAEFVFTKDPERSMQVVLRSDEEELFGPVAPIISFLEKVTVASSKSVSSTDYLIQYLQYLLFQRRIEEAQVHEKYISVLLDRIQRQKEHERKEMAKNGSKVSLDMLSSRGLLVQDSPISQSANRLTESEEVKRLRQELSNFLGESTHYRAENVIVTFPFEGLLEERVILLGRIGKHEQALQLIIEEMEAYDMAEKYCARNYHYEKAPEVYGLLFKYYLKKWKNQVASSGGPLGNGGKAAIKFLNKFVLRVLEQHASKVNYQKVLSNLPNHILISKLRLFLESSFQLSYQNQTLSQLQRSLAISANTQNKQILMEQRQARVSIQEDTLCSVCFKKLGTSAFVYEPRNHKIVHFVCHSNQ